MLKFVKYVLFGIATVLFAIALDVEVVEITEVVFENVAGAADVVNSEAAVVVFEVADDVNLAIVNVNVVELT